MPLVHEYKYEHTIALIKWSRPTELEVTRITTHHERHRTLGGKGLRTSDSELDLGYMAAKKNTPKSLIAESFLKLQ